MSLKNNFGRKTTEIYRISLKQQETADETRELQKNFEHDLRIWLRDQGAYKDGTVTMVRRGVPSSNGEPNVIIRTTHAKLAEIVEKYEGIIGGVHIGKMSDVLYQNGTNPNQPRP